MRRRAGAATVALVALAFETFALEDVARADDTVRVIIAGPKKDPIAMRLEKELVALGYAPIAVGALPDCTAPAVGDAVKNAGASAALCSNGERIAVWTDDGTDVKLRDTVQVKGGASGQGTSVDTVAMQAAEVMRANIAFREPEPVTPAEPPPPPSSSPPLTDPDWDEFNKDSRPPLDDGPRRTARFGFSAGASVLASSGAALTGLSFGATYGLHRYVSIQAQAEVPVTGTRANPLTSERPTDNSHTRITPGLVGVGVEIPFTKADSFFIPRLGASVGAAWIHASKTAGVVPGSDGVPLFNTTETSDTTAAPAAWITAAVSFRLVGPVRMAVNGLVGATAGEITVLNQGVAVAKWGLPIGSLGGRLELLLP